MNVEEIKRRAGPREFSPKDDLPEEYRKAATRMLEFHANSEIMGAYLERPFVRKAPSLERKMAFSAKVQDEIGHGQLLYRAAESLGVKTREEMLDDLAAGRGKFLNCFHYPMDEWVETPMIAFFVDGAAMRRQATLKRSSWEPYAHAMDKICFEEGFHVKHGESILSELMNGSRKEREMTQAAFERWWPRIRENDDGTYDVVEDDLDWGEFAAIARNEYEPGLDRINGRKQAQEAVGWVRDVLDEGEARAAGGDTQQAAD